MKKSIVCLLSLVFVSFPAVADRITQMSKTERCVYTARLQVLAHYYFKQGTPRDQIKVHWKGDETENEIAFVGRALDEAYAWLVARGAEATALSEQVFGDMVYDACMSGQPL
ncbi:MAG TPA: hypothetical protein VNM24_08785 [Burkholderiales bacterium]|jgi:hypothetical protein|nr:hypothetical protein [Burkholderiales bacterium]